MIIWISGPYGVGKTTLAEAMAAKMDNALVFDAEEEKGEEPFGEIIPAVPMVTYLRTTPCGVNSAICF